MTEKRGRPPLSGDRADPSRRIYAYLPQSLIDQLDAAEPTGDDQRAGKVRRAIEFWLSEK